ncbi:MAG: ribosome assembly RNA-binding protein YhbY [Ruminococcus sp.]|nr:ribosome assembly RNA-binding protein YhbY [Ruminococcus sp.]
MINGKQRAYLRGLANPIDTIIYIGKGGITEQVVKQTDDALTARELVKGKVLENSTLSSRDVAVALSETLNTEVVQVIGSKFVLYRPNPDEPQIKLPRIKKK